MRIEPLELEGPRPQGRPQTRPIINETLRLQGRLWIVTAVAAAASYSYNTVHLSTSC